MICTLVQNSMHFRMLLTYCTVTIVMHNALFSCDSYETFFVKYYKKVCARARTDAIDHLIYVVLLSITFQTVCRVFASFRNI